MDCLAYSSSSSVYLQNTVNPYSSSNHTNNSFAKDSNVLSSVRCSASEASFTESSYNSNISPNNHLSSDNHSSKSLNLSIHPLNTSQIPFKLVTLPHSVPLEPLPHINPMQGPHTNEYFGHGDIHHNQMIRQSPDHFYNLQQSPYGINTKGNEMESNFYSRRENNPYTSIDHSDMIEVPSDPYDNTTGEQRFCGGYGEWAHVVNHTERSILPDLKQYAFADDIKNQADVIYNKMRYQVRRGKIRYQMLFFCVYCAHLELGRDVNPVQLGHQFGLTQGEVQRCDSLFSPLQTGYKPPSTNTSPLGYLPDYCRDMNLSQEAIADIMKMAATVLRKDPTLYQENPQTVAAGLLRYYTITNGVFTDDPQKITRVTSRSNVTIDGMFRRISSIDNS